MTRLTCYTMVRATTPQFCASCHEIQFAYNTWKTSSHVNNAQGFVADWMDCHLPAPHDTFDFFYAKTLHGIKDVIVHFIQEYNEVYYKPAQKMLDEPYAKGLLDQTRFFDEELEIEFYELWHHEGRRTRFGAAMMAPDYTWWHGFMNVKR